MDPGLDIVHILQDFRLSMPPSVESFFVFLSSPLFYVGVPLILGAMLFWFSDKQKGETILFIFASAMAVNRMIKVTVKQPRPWVLDPTIQPSDAAKATAGGYSLPSGHTTMAVSAYGAFALLVKSPALKVFAILMVALIPVSRLILNVHTPLDIATGVIVAVFVCLFNMKAVPWSHRNERNRLIFLGGYLAFFIITAVYLLIVTEDYANANFIFMAIGLVVGLFIEERYIHYEIRERPRKQKLIIGISGLILMGLMFGIPYLLLGYGYSIAIGGSMCMISATAICPYLIKRYDETHRTD